VRLGRHLDKFQALKDYYDEENELSISVLCQMLKVSRSGYYKWLNHKETTSENLNRELMTHVKDLHHKHNGIFGYRRMTLYVNRLLGT
ncbi:IS3-like element ISSth1b family transposase, partial [Streptococcus pyogenes]